MSVGILDASSTLKFEVTDSVLIAKLCSGFSFKVLFLEARYTG